MTTDQWILMGRATDVPDVTYVHSVLLPPSELHQCKQKRKKNFVACLME